MTTTALYQPSVSDSPDIGVFSPYTLMLHQDATQERGIALLKRAAVLFEHLLVVPVGLGGFRSGLMTKEMYLALLDRDDPFTREKPFQNIFLEPEDLGLKFRELQAVAINPGEEDLWGPKYGSRYVQFVTELVDERLAISKQNDDRQDMLKYFIGNISADHRLLKHMASTLPSCSGLLTQLHEEALITVAGLREGSAPILAERVAGLSTFDFASLSWENIVRLRADGFVSGFRKKMTEWVLMYSYAKSQDEYIAELDKYIESAKSTLIGMAEPRLTKTVIGGVAGFLPYGIAELVGVGKFVKDVKQGAQLKRDMAWLFFINRAKKLTVAPTNK